MLVNNLAVFGGLEEFAVNLAAGIKKQGHEVSFVSAAWAPADNQYLRSLRKHGITCIQLPKWLSVPAAEWPTKHRILTAFMGLASPLAYVLAAALCLLKRRSWAQAVTSAQHWLRDQLVSRFEPARRQPFVQLLLECWRFGWRPDILHIHGYTSDLLFAIDWAHTRGVPVIYEEHQTPDAQFDWWQTFEQSINKASTIIAVSEKSAIGLREVCGVTRPIQVAYYMVPDPAESGRRADETTRGDTDPIRVTTSARLYVTKGLTVLLDAIALVKAAHPTTRFRVYGDGPLRHDLLAYAEQLGLVGTEIFVGAYTSREELSHIMADTDIFVLSSILEGLPIALLEAMSYGRPVVATTVGGIPEAIEDGVNGLLCPPRDPVCLAQKIGRLVEDRELRLRLSRAARAAYEAGPYNPTAVCQRYASIYHNTLASYGARVKPGLRSADTGPLA